MKVFINPGHAPNGIPDPGAVNHTRGTQEWEVAADVGKLLERYLNNVGIATETLQDNSLGKICNAANASGADLFVSIHCNGYTTSNARGTETWYYEGSFNGRKLAMAIQAQIVSALGTVDRGIKPTRGLYVIKYTDMTAVLVELGFITNDDDCVLMETRRDEYAAAIARGVTDYMLM